MATYARPLLGSRKNQIGQVQLIDGEIVTVKFKDGLVRRFHESTLDVTLESEVKEAAKKRAPRKQAAKKSTTKTK